MPRQRIKVKPYTGLFGTQIPYFVSGALNECILLLHISKRFQTRPNQSISIGRKFPDFYPWLCSTLTDFQDVRNVQETGEMVNWEQLENDPAFCCGICMSRYQVSQFSLGTLRLTD